MIEKIKKELQQRFELSDGTIEIIMRKSGDTVIITADADAEDPDTVFVMKSFKLQPIRIKGMDSLAVEIINYDRTVAKQQNAIAGLYAFKRERIDTGMASASEREWYVGTFESVFGYKPSVAA